MKLLVAGKPLLTWHVASGMMSTSPALGVMLAMRLLCTPMLADAPTSGALSGTVPQSIVCLLSRLKRPNRCAGLSKRLLLQQQPH